MEEQHAHIDDQSHYEISLTAGQAFVAFVLLLLSLAASFAFGLMIGKGQADERLVVRKETPIVTEGALIPGKGEGGGGGGKSDGRIVELGVQDDDFRTPEPAAAAPEATPTDVTTTAASTATVVEAADTAAAPAPAIVEPEPAPAPAHAPAAVAANVPPPAAPAAKVITYAQLLSTSDQKTAETLAARLIDRGFTSAYVERGSTEKGSVYRVRVKFPSEPDARAAEPKLREFSKDVWITTR